MNHEQLISRNHVEFAQMVNVFHELNSVYDNQFTLYLDSTGWELFDLRTAKVILKNDFKNFNIFTQSMKRLMNDLCNVGVANQLVNRGRKPKNNMIWSIKSLLNYYPLDDRYIYNTNLKNYMNYGFKQKAKVMADSY